MKTTQFHAYHKQNAHMTEFAGYEMPVWYTSISDEHLAVRNSCGVFDVSHMGRIHIAGPGSGRLLERLVPTNVVSQPRSKAIYTILLNDNGGILEDLIIMKMSEGDYLVVVNAINTATDLEHILNYSEGLDAAIQNVTESSAMIALQGPDSAKILQPLTTADLSELKRFRCLETQVSSHDSTISRTGYTGEDGFEIIMHGMTKENLPEALSVWENLARVAKPCGLAARDSLRIEAGYPLYGADINTETNPFEADLAWVVSAGKEGYVGSEAVARAGEAGLGRVRRGMVLDEKIPRSGYDVLNSTSDLIGKVTSGTFSPILRKGIAMGLIADTGSVFGGPVRVKIRDAIVGASIVQPPFYDEKLYGWKRQSNGK
jgi:aminomethyltransferase